MRGGGEGREPTERLQIVPSVLKLAENMSSLPGTVMSINKDDKNARHKMIKRVQMKDDGRILIYYTFDDSDCSSDCDNEPQVDSEKESKI
jgi:hypothetical protein